MERYRTSYVKPGRDGRRPRLCVTYEEDGKRHEMTRAADPKRISALRREAEEWRLELNREWEADLDRRRREEEDARIPKLDDYLMDYVSDKVVEGIEGSTSLNYAHYANWIVEEGGGLSGTRLDRITPVACKAWQRHLLGRGICADTVAHCLSFLKTVLNTAEADEIIARNPIAKVRGPKVPRRKPNALDRQSVSRLRSWVRDGCDWMRTAVALGLFAGMRRGEICALQWRDVNFPERRIHLHQAIGMRRDGSYLKGPKNGEPRDFRISGDLLAALKRRYNDVAQHLVNFYGEAGAERRIRQLYVCGLYDGRWREPSVVSSTWLRLRKELGLTGTRRETCTFHDLRHTFITYMVLCGVPVSSIMPIVGHSDAAMTLNVYASVDDRAIDEAAEAIDGALPSGEDDDGEPRYILPSPDQ